MGGTIDVDATMTGVSKGVTTDTVEATGTIELQPSTVGGLAITRASVDGDYHASTGNIRTFEIVGPDLNATASGRLALNETGQSSLKVHADSPTLGELGALVDVPVTGIGKVDATITGNKRALQ